MKNILLESTLLVLFFTLMGLWIMGGESSELDRLQAAAEYRERFMNGCMPRKGDIVTAQWEKGELVCRRITPSPRYGRTFPHAEIRLSEIEQ